MSQKNTSQNIPHVFLKVWNGNINVAGTDADKDYIKFRECPRVNTVWFVLRVALTHWKQMIISLEDDKRESAFI